MTDPERVWSRRYKVLIYSLNAIGYSIGIYFILNNTGAFRLVFGK